MTKLGTEGTEQGKSPATDISPLEHYTLVRGQIEHEDNLVGQRISWFVSAQSFFFSGYAIVTSNLHPEGHQWVYKQVHGLFILIPILASANCVISGMMVLAGIRALHHLRNGYEQWLKMAGTSTPCGIPPVQGKRLTQNYGQMGPAMLPPLFFMVWMILLFRGMK